MFRTALLTSMVCLAACSGSPAPTGNTDDAGSDAGPVDKSATCVGTFGTDIGAVGFARFDGTVVAVLAPGNKTCPAPNSTHLVIELKSGPSVYRMVVDVNDLYAANTIRFKSVLHELVGVPWADGWHTGVPLDYVTNFGLHSTDFYDLGTADAVARLTDALQVGAKVSIYATASGEVDSAHLIHRNKNGTDGAIVVDVDGSPLWLLLNFSNYTF